jgi:hypothetical protein
MYIQGGVLHMMITNFETLDRFFQSLVGGTDGPDPAELDLIDGFVVLREYDTDSFVAAYVANDSPASYAVIDAALRDSYGYDFLKDLKYAEPDIDVVLEILSTIAGAMTDIQA